MKLFKWISLALMIPAPLVIIFIYFYDRQQASVGLNFTGIVFAIIMLAITYNRFKEWLIVKKTAKETATNLGKTSKNYNIIFINILNYFYLASPFAILLWLNWVIENYEGQIAWPIILILSSFAVSCLFNVFHEVDEQRKLAESEKEEQDKQTKAIGDYVASKLGG